MLEGRMYGVATRRCRARMSIEVAGTLLAAAGMSCADLNAPPPPAFGYIQTTVSQTGLDLDTDGFIVTLDGVQSARTADASQFQKFFVQLGAHSVSLSNIAANCTVDGPNPRPVSLVEGQVVSVVFEVACVRTGITVTTTTS